MNSQDVIDFINGHQACTLATIDNGKPRLRGMLMYRADEQGILFHTGTFKALYAQLVKCADVELCFNDFEKGVQLRCERKSRASARQGPVAGDYTGTSIFAAICRQSGTTDCSFPGQRLCIQ